MKRSGFTVIELMVGILIFTIGLLSAYVLIYSSLATTSHSRDEIIAGNIAREKIELLRNMRDSNWIGLYEWDKLDKGGIPSGTLTGGYYTIANDFSPTSGKLIVISKVAAASFTGTDSDILDPINGLHLCLDSHGRYGYACAPTNRETSFYSYLKVSSLQTTSDTGAVIIVKDAFRVDSIVFVKGKAPKRYTVSTILTDWKKLYE